MRIALIHGPLKSAVCDSGVGHQMPLGLLMIGGPLLAAGYPVQLIDAASEHLPDAEIVRRVAAFDSDVVMIAHVGSTSAHPCCLRVLRAVKAALPHCITIYGGVHPTYHYRAILAEQPEVDIIVRGEGEATVLDLVHTLAAAVHNEAKQVNLSSQWDLSSVPGIAWRSNGIVATTASRTPIADLGAYPIGWELIKDWDHYHAFGLGRAAVVQFSRGCPHTCTYCGQWMFWRRWRYREVKQFVDELAWLHREHQVRFFWLADENPTTIKDVWQRVLQEIADRKLPIGLCASIRAQDIVRDADILPLYKRAGFVYVLMGVETVTDDTLAKIHKGSCVDDAYQAVRLLRQHQIVSIVRLCWSSMGVVPFALPVPNSYMSWIGAMVSTVFLFKRRVFLNLTDCLSLNVSRQPGRLLRMVVSTKELKPQVPLWMPSFRFPFFSLSADYLESTILRTRCMHGWQKIGAISQAFAPIVSVLVNLVASD